MKEQKCAKHNDSPSYGSQFRKERSSMAMSPVKSSPTVPSIKICDRKNEHEHNISSAKHAEQSVFSTQVPIVSKKVMSEISTKQCLNLALYT